MRVQARDTLQDSTNNSLEWQEYFSPFQGTSDALPCHIHLPVCLWIMDPYRRAPKKNTNHGNELLPQNTTYLIQRPCYQQGSPRQDPAGNRTTVKRRKLQCYGHVFRSSGLAKTVLQGTMKRGRRQGRQRKRWEDIIREWTGLEFAKSQRAVENREKWKKVVARSSLVPQQPSQLRDRQWDNDDEHLPHCCTKRWSSFSFFFFFGGGRGGADFFSLIESLRTNFACSHISVDRCCNTTYQRWAFHWSQCRNESDSSSHSHPNSWTGNTSVLCTWNSCTPCWLVTVWWSCCRTHTSCRRPHSGAGRNTSPWAQTSLSLSMQGFCSVSPLVTKKDREVIVDQSAGCSS